MVAKKKKQKKTLLDDLSADHKKLLRSRSATKKKLIAYVKKWKRQLWLGQWNVDTVWEWDGLGEDTTTAKCQCDWRYMIATITFDLIRCSTLDDEGLERIVIHELLHMVVNEMRYDGLEHEERVVSHLTSVIHFMK